MRQRSTTIEDLSEITEPNTTNYIMPLESSKKDEVAASYSQSLEKWVEGEYSATLKALEIAYSENDANRASILQKALMDLEKRSSVESTEAFSESPRISTFLSTSTEPCEIDDCELSSTEKNKLEKMILQNIKQYDYLLNITLIGESKTGKSSFIHTFVNGYEPSNLKETNGIEDKAVIKIQRKERVKYRMWDTDSNRKHQNIRKVYYSQSHAILIMFDITNRDSYVALRFWVNSMLSFNSQRVSHPLLYIIGNKADLKENRRVSIEEAASFSANMGFRYYEASITDSSISEIFEVLTDEILFQAK